MKAKSLLDELLRLTDQELAETEVWVTAEIIYSNDVGSDEYANAECKAEKTTHVKENKTFAINGET